MTGPDLTPQELLAACRERAGMSLRQFARQAMGRDERTLRRWLAGTQDIPPAALEWLRAFLASNPPPGTGD